MTDNGMKGLVKGLLSGPPQGNEQYGQPMMQQPEMSQQHQALQVLNLAQRTAEEQIATARREAERVHAEARAMADQIIREAQSRVHSLQQEAEQALAKAHGAAAQIDREAQIRAENAQHDAEEVLADARARAADIVNRAQASADELRQQAEQRYDDVVGSLATKREALQRQIEALEQFDREYRARLTTFMQNQMRALWVDEPQVIAAEIENSEQEPPNTPLTVQWESD